VAEGDFSGDIERTSGYFQCVYRLMALFLWRTSFFLSGKFFCNM
jgi:hypothetical protein